MHAVTGINDCIRAKELSGTKLGILLHSET